MYTVVLIVDIHVTKPLAKLQHTTDEYKYQPTLHRIA